MSAATWFPTRAVFLSAARRIVAANPSVTVSAELTNTELSFRDDDKRVWLGAIDRAGDITLRPPRRCRK